MPPYSKSKLDCLSGGEDVLVAESNGVVLGAVSISHKDISCVYGEWRDGFEQCLNNLASKVSGGWTSKLYVFPEYRRQGIGTKLVKEAIERLKKKEFTEAYAGIYVENECRTVSEHIFQKNGFRRVGSCICFLTEGHCRGVLLKKTIASGEQREKK
jgi:ribosomal protein S18 acetylase RimI-like enzyme